MTCPHCKNEIEIKNGMAECPICKESIFLTVKNQLIAEDFVNRLLSRGDKQIIEEMLLHDKSLDAMHYVRKIRGKGDPLAEKRIVLMIENGLYNNTSIHYDRKESDKRKTTLSPCSACGYQISIRAESCPHCGNPTGVHVCPKCNSINTRVITGTSKAASIFLWGAFAANKVVSKYECKDCGHKF